MNNAIYIKTIDNLGRIVIPKEIRELLRIKNNDSVEINVKGDTILIKKYSVMDRIEDTTKNMTEAISYFVHHNILITNRDKIISYVGKSKENIVNKNISKRLEIAIERREQIYERNTKKLAITDKFEINGSYIIDSIIYKGEVAGLVVVYDENKEITQDDYRAIQIITKFLNKYLED